MKTINIYISESDAEEMAQDLRNGEEGVWQSWIPLIEGTDERVNLVIHLGDEEE
tara:strand:- start:1055 stop:1216 length:162 start_codon:yes stop_codon:yes gene_type:complete